MDTGQDSCRTGQDRTGTGQDRTDLDGPAGQDYHRTLQDQNSYSGMAKENGIFDCN